MIVWLLVLEPLTNLSTYPVVTYGDTHVATSCIDLTKIFHCYPNEYQDHNTMELAAFWEYTCIHV